MNEQPPSYLGQNNVTPYRRTEILRRLLWSVIQATVFRWSPRPCHRIRVSLLRWFGATISDPRTVRIYPTAIIVFPWKLTLHPHSLIGPDVNIYNLAPVTIGYGTLVSQQCHLCAGTHDFRRWDMPLVTAPITLGSNVWLAADVFVGPGVTIGELAVVGARSVVVRDLPARMICVGNPCHPVKERPEPV